MTTQKYIASDFSGGMNRQLVSTKIASNEYFYLSNGRVREGSIRPVKLPVQQTQGLPNVGTNYQGVYSAGTFLLLFVDGKAYYRDASVSTSTFTRILGLQMDANVGTIYATLIPTSYSNYLRKSTTGNASDGVNLTSAIAATPQGVLVQDGINQPWLIMSDATARVTQTYAQWTPSTPEYVPVGTIMMYDPSTGILFMVGIDEFGKPSVLFRSVSGRALDFMVAVNAAGGKISASEQLGGAPAVSYRVDYDPITCLSQVPSNLGSFFMSTTKTCYLIKPDLTKLIYGEPTFGNQFVAPTGVLNNFSLCDTAGDSAMIDATGVISFNAVSSDRVEGKNLPFSGKIFSLFQDIIQTTVAAINFDNYALFGLTTVYGAGVMVFDTVLQKWIAFDQFPQLGLVKQFTEVKILGNTRKLFCITTDGKLWQLFAGGTATCRLVPIEFAANIPGQEQQAQDVDVVLSDVKSNGVLEVTCYNDRMVIKTLSQQMVACVDVLTNPQSVPWNVYKSKGVETPSFDFTGSENSVGWKLGYLLSWNVDCTLDYLVANANLTEVASTVQAQVKILKDGATQNSQADKFVVVGNDGVAGYPHLALAQLVKAENPSFVLGAGNHNYPAGDVSTLAATLVPFWGQENTNRKAWFALGNIDLDTLNGRAAIEYYNYVPHPSQRYFNQSFGLNTEVFFYNGGYKSDGSLVEPDGVDVNSMQGVWLKSALANSTAKCKIVLVGEPVWTSSVAKYPGKASLQTLLFKSWGANLVVSCGTLYERVFIGGLNYLTCGMGGHDLGAAVNSPVVGGSVKTFNAQYGYLVVTVYNFYAQVQFKDILGVIQDSFTINL